MGRRNKVSVTFDDQNRREYLLGFHKRKDIRRKVAKQKIAEKITAERKAMRDARRKTSGVPHIPLMQDIEDLECVVKQETVDLPTHSVTITQLDDLEIAQQDLYLGRNVGVSAVNNYSDEKVVEEPASRRQSNKNHRNSSRKHSSATGDPKKLKSLEKMMAKIKGTNRRSKTQRTVQGGKTSEKEKKAKRN